MAKTHQRKHNQRQQREPRVASESNYVPPEQRSQRTPNKFAEYLKRIGQVQIVNASTRDLFTRLINELLRLSHETTDPAFKELQPWAAKVSAECKDCKQDLEYFLNNLYKDAPNASSTYLLGCKPSVDENKKQRRDKEGEVITFCHFWVTKRNTPKDCKLDMVLADATCYELLSELIGVFSYKLRNFEYTREPLGDFDTEVIARLKEAKDYLEQLLAEYNEQVKRYRSLREQYPENSDFPQDTSQSYDETVYDDHLSDEEPAAQPLPSITVSANVAKTVKPGLSFASMAKKNLPVETKPVPTNEDTTPVDQQEYPSLDNSSKKQRAPKRQKASHKRTSSSDDELVEAWVDLEIAGKKTDRKSVV